MSVLKIGFQGVKGAFSEEALIQYFEHDVTAIPHETFEDLFIALGKDQIAYGVLPIENSSTGAVTDVYDLLNKYDCTIVGETRVKVNHHLMGIPGTSLEDIQEVYSHPQAFDQSKDYLSSYPWKLIPYYNTARSAEYVMTHQKKHIAAIGSKKAAELYHLQILTESINSNHQNTTRFIIIGKTLEHQEVHNKISVVLSTPHKAGALYHVLKHFAEHNINMLKIESRPVGHTPWEYFFYIDFEGNVENPAIKEALDHMSRDCHHFKLLGNYTMAKS